MDLTFNNDNYDKSKIRIEIYGKNFTNFITSFDLAKTIGSTTINNLLGQSAAYGIDTPVREGSLSMTDAGLRELNKIATKAGFSDFTELVGYNLDGIENDIVIQAVTYNNKIDTYVLKGVTFNTFSFGFQSGTAVYEREVPYTYMNLSSTIV